MRARVTANEVEFDVVYEVVPCDGGTKYAPPSGENIEIEEIYIGSVEVSMVISDSVYDEIIGELTRK